MIPESPAPQSGLAARQLAALTPGARAALAARVRTSGAGQARIQRRVGTDPAPLSFAQERLAFVDSYERDSVHHNDAVLLLLRGRLDVEALRMAIAEVVRRHEILRTSFSLGPDRAVQVPQDPSSRQLPVVDLPGARMDPDDPVLGEAVRSDMRRPLDLAGAETMRETLYRLGPDQHVLGVTIHHLVCDLWSLSVFVDELSVLYSSYSRQEMPSLPELPLQYADYAIWQRSGVSEARLAADLSYWTQVLDGAPPLLELPTRGPRPAIQRFIGAVERFTVDAETTRRLTVWSQSNGFTPFMGLLSVFSILMRRYSGSDDIVVATPVASREPRELERLIGCFLNLIVLRADLSGDPTFRELAGRVKTACLGAYAHQQLPFERLVTQLAPARTRSHQPIAQVAFVLQNVPESRLELPGVEADFHAMDTGRARLDVSVRLTQSRDGLTGEFEYDADLFDSSWVRQLGRDFAATIAAVAAEPDAAISVLPAIDDATARELRTWNDTATDFGTKHLIHGIFAAQARRSPGATAVMSGNATATYGEIDTSANRMAWYLQGLGVGPETPVAVCLERSIREVTTILAILKAGGVYVPVNPRDPAARRDTILDLAAPSVVLSCGDLADEVWSPGRRVVDLEEVAADIAACPGKPVDVGISPDNLAYILFTSGTMGQPKGVMVSHRGFSNRMLWGQSNYELTPADRVLRKAACTFDVSLDELFRALFNGATSVLMPERAFDPRQVARVIQDAQVTDADFSPTALRELISGGHLASCVSLTRIVSGVEELSGNLARGVLEALDVKLFNLYGPTEVSVSCTARECPPGEHRPVIPIGRPIANMRAYILDASLRQVPVGVTGELYIAGVGLARGYLGRPDLTAGSFVPDPFALEAGGRLYRTGDLARYTGTGEIEFRGRADRQLNFRGYRIEADEIETRLCAVPGVTAAVVAVRPDEVGDSRLVAYITGTFDLARSVSELRSILRQDLPAYMIPGSFVPVTTLPQTEHGKLDLSALPDPLAQVGVRVPAEESLPRTPQELILARIWQEVLAVEQVGINDDFFDLGGDSLTATRIVGRAREEFGRDIEVGSIFDHPTIAELSSLFES